MWKLAREGTIFAFLGVLVGVMGAIVAIESTASCEARTYAAATVHGRPVYASLRLAFPSQEGDKTKVRTFPGKQLVRVPIDSTVLWVWACSDSEAGVITEATEEASDCRPIHEPVKKVDGLVPELRAGDRAALERDYWAAYHQSKHGLLVHTLLHGADDLTPRHPILLFSLYGFLAGLGIWIFYRVARVGRDAA